MIAWIILLCVLLLLLLLLLAPVSVRFAYRREEIKASAHYLFFRMNLSPDALARRKEKAGKKEKKAKPKEKPEGEPEKKKEKRVKVTSDDILPLLRSCTGALRRICRGTVIYRLRASIAIGKEDAHQTAVAYGTACTAAAVGLEILDELFDLREPQVRITPDFVRGHTACEVSLRVRIAPLTVLTAAFDLLVWLLKQLLAAPKGKKRKKSTNQTVKGGIQHESAASHQ